MIKIKLVTMRKKNLDRKSLFEPFSKMGPPLVGLMGTVALSVVLAGGLVANHMDGERARMEEGKKGYEFGVSYLLPPRKTAEEDLGSLQSKVETLASQSAETEYLKPLAVVVPKDVVHNQAIPHREAKLSTPIHASSDKLLDERIQAGREWIANKKEGFSVQLMMVSKNSLDGLDSLLSRPEIALMAENVLAFPISDDRILLYNGTFDSREEAERSKETLSEAIRKTGPYVLSMKSIVGKVERLSASEGKIKPWITALKK